MKLFPAVILILIFLASACTTPLQLPRDNSAQKRVFLPFRIDSIIIVDNRLDTLSTDMRLPPLALRKREWIIKPGISPDVKSEILEMVRNASNPEGIPSIVTFSVEEGYYKVTGDATKVGEHTKFDCVLNFDLLALNTHIKTSASAYYDYEGIFNATEKHVKEVYKVTVRNSVFNALKQAETSLDD